MSDMTTQRLQGVIRALGALRYGDKSIDALEYRRRAEEAAAEWKTWLAREYAPDLSQEVTDLLYEKAYEDGHANGYEEIEVMYADLVEFVKKVQRSAAEAGWDEGRTSVALDFTKPLGEDGMRPSSVNPYRA